MRPQRIFQIVDPSTITAPKALSIGIYSFTGQGKTKSSLELACGIQQVTGGDIYLADCDNGRGLHFVQGKKAEYPGVNYIDFKAPHNALDYVDLMEMVAQKPRAILVIDNMTAEHEGEGGYLESKEEAMYDKNGKYKEGRTPLAWNLAVTPHKKMVRVFAKLNRELPMIVTWRANDKLDWGHKNAEGKVEPQAQGEMPIGRKDLPFEMTATYLLPVGSRGAPCLDPTEKGERMMTKIPGWFEGIIKPGEKFRREHGEAMARWAFGSSEPAQAPRSPVVPRTTADHLKLLADKLAAASTSDEVDSIAESAKKLKLNDKQDIWISDKFAEARERIQPRSKAEAAAEQYAKQNLF